MPIMPRYLDKLRNKFAGTGLYDDQDEFNQGFMADSAGPTGSFRKDSMVAQEPPPLPAQSELPPPPPLAPFSDMPSDNPDTDNPMLTAQQGPPPPPRGIAGPPTPEQLMAERAAMKAPEVSKPSKWQMLAAAGIGGLQGYKNAARPQDRPMDLDIQSIVRPNLTRQMGDYSRKAKDLDSRIKTAGDVEQISTNKAYREGMVADRKMAGEDRKENRQATAEQRIFNAELALASAGGKVADPNMQPDPDHQRVSFNGKFYDVPQKGMVKVTNAEAAKFLNKKVGETVTAEENTKALEIAGKIAELQAKPKEEKTTADWTNYQLSKGEGFKGTFEDWQTRDANRKAPRISVGGDDGKRLTPSEATALGVPYGTTRAEAEGKMPSTDGQKKEATYAARMERANDVVGRLEADISKQGVIGQAYQGAVPNFMKSENTQVFEQAKRDFMNAILRQESGAAIAPSEFASADKQYFPQPGDGPGSLEQKRINRKIALDGLAKAAGNAYQPTAKVDVPASPGPGRNGTPKVGDTKRFPNGAMGKWDGHGWVAQ